jgi:hypothetical protein
LADRLRRLVFDVLQLGHRHAGIEIRLSRDEG